MGIVLINGIKTQYLSTRTNIENAGKNIMTSADENDFE